jgi:outer membrane protein assembly factor BamB
MKKIKFLLILFFCTKNLFASDNFYNIQYSKDDLKNISKSWMYNSGILNDTQNKIVNYNEKLIHLDGNKNLLIISLTSGKEICKNQGKIDRAPYRGIALYKNSDGVYAVFLRHNILKLINIDNCQELLLKNKIKIKNVTAPILINNTIAIILPNGSEPKAYSLVSGDLIWKASISNEKINNLKKINLGKNFYWDVWGGGTLDLKYNQIIFSTANAKPSFISEGREGPNLFFNSVVSIDLRSGVYNWHFQEIEHDVLNLDLASRPALFDGANEDVVVQASKTGQLILLNRKNGKPLQKFNDFFFFHDGKVKSFTKIKKFEDWLQFSKSNFKADDVNDLNDQYKIEAQNIINNSLISEYRKLNVDKNYIHYGMHGGSEWPGIAVDNVGQVIIPASNIAWISKLRNPDEFNFLFHIKKIFISSFNLITLDFYVLKKNVNSIFDSFKDIFNYNTLDIEAYKRFASKDGIPLNSPPWGTITLIDIKDKKIKWQVPHGNYPQLDSKYNNKGSEIFGCPVFLGKEIFFISGARDKKIYAYDVKNGDILWEDNLPYVSYGCPIIAEFDKNIYLIIDASGGRKFEDAKKGDAVIAYKLK